MFTVMVSRSLSSLRYLSLPPRSTRPTHRSGGPNLEVFKFGMYIAFPIGWMYYFGTNLDTRFTVPDFWPKPEETHKLPFEKEELGEMREKLKEIRLEKRRRRLDGLGGMGKEDLEGRLGEARAAEGGRQVGRGGGGFRVGGRGSEGGAEGGRGDVGEIGIGDRGFGRGVIERWARGE